MTLLGEDGNAFALLARFRVEAKRQGWPPRDIAEVLTKARSSDYAHLVRTLLGHIDEPTRGKASKPVMATVGPSRRVTR